MSSQARQVTGTSRKRKEPDGSDAPKGEPGGSGAPAAAGNRLLAGYLAHEFLTRGTLFGRRWDPAGPGPGPSEPVATKNPSPSEPRAYAEVACLLKAEGTHIPGVVNPTQLARWLQM